MTLIFAVQALRRHILLGLITVLAVTGAGIAIGSAWPKTYTSHAGILLGADIKGSKMDPQTANLYLKDRVATYAELMTADEVVTPIAEGAGVTSEELRNKIVVAIVPETVVLEVSVTGASPAQAVELTQAVTKQFSDQVSTFNVQTGGPAILPAQLFGPQPASEPDQLHGTMLAAVSGLVGLVLGVLLTLVVALLRAGRAVAVRPEQAKPAEHVPGDVGPSGKRVAIVPSPGPEVTTNGAQRQARRRVPQAVDWSNQ